MSRIDYGTIEVTIAGTEYTLKPTLKAYQAIERRFGGLRSALESCSNMSIDGIAAIIAAGANLDRDARKELPDAIFAEGSLNVLPLVTEYLMKLLNPSGKEPDGDEEPSGEA